MSDGWIKWYGGKCPVAYTTLVDVRHRNGETHFRQEAGVSAEPPLGMAHDWSVAGYHPGDIIEYRLSAPAEDVVNNPSHYTAGGIECIDYLEAKLTPEQFIGFCRGNTIKYSSRAGKKSENAVEDMEKAAWYTAREIDFRKRKGL